MSASWIQRVLLAAFPPRFKHRYGAELADLVPSCGGGSRVTADLARAVAKEWARPTFLGDAEERRRLRLQATTSTVFLSWSLATVAVAVFARGVDDQPVRGLRSWGWSAFRVGTVEFELTVAVIMAAGFWYWLRVVGMAWRERRYGILVPACLPAVVATGWLAVTGLLSYAFNGDHLHKPGTAPGPSTFGGWVVLVLYGLFTVGSAMLCAGSAVWALERAGLSVRLLTRSTALAAVSTASLVALTVTMSVCLTRVLMIGGLSRWDTFLSVGPAVVMVAMCVTSVTSTARGLRALVLA